MNIAGGISLSGPQIPPTVLPDSIIVDALYGLSKAPVGPGQYIAFLGQNIDEPGDPALIINNKEIPLEDTVSVRFIARAGSSAGIFDILPNKLELKDLSGFLRFCTITPTTFSLVDTDNNSNPGIGIQKGSDDFAIDMVQTIPDAFIRFKSNNTEAISINCTGPNVLLVVPTAISNNITTPRGWLELASGGPTLPPFVYNTGTDVQTVPIDGAKNFDGNQEYLTTNGVNFIMAKTLIGSTTLNYAGVAALNCEDQNIPLNGAAVGDPVFLGYDPTNLPANAWLTAFVSAPDTVTVRMASFVLVAGFSIDVTASIQKL